VADGVYKLLRAHSAALGFRIGAPDTGYLNVGHSWFLSGMRTKLCSSPYAERGRGPLGQLRQIVSYGLMSETHS
jgi:hypothetical protein